ncbi:hypothetical protein ACFFNY_16265 [Paenibacillus hodogayensis]|uniref:Beta-agarase n=1 Tax=Paenibacillus hodogayensis TaxID=279208 RepID=A0ABV5VXV1_9BACL
MNGFYRIGQRAGDGRWTLEDGDGRPFYSLGVNCFNYDLGEPMEAYLMDRYGGVGWFGRWAGAKLDGVKELGFNTLGAWHSRYYWNSKVPKTIEIRCSQKANRVNNGWGGYGFPDVFDPSFAASAHSAMADTYHASGASLVDDRSVIGVYTDNELHWWGTGGHWGQDDPGSATNGTNLVEDYIHLPANAPGKRAWIDYLRERYGDIGRLNAAWNAEYDTFEELLWLREYRAAEPAYGDDKLGFLRRIAETYFRTTTDILRQYDGNHLLLGCRMVGTSTPDVVLEAMKPYVDALSLNYYCFELPEAWIARAHRITGKPVIITEFSFSAGSSAGFDLITNGAQLAHVRDQKRRGESYRDFVTQAARMPFMLGTHWFALYDFWDRQGLIGNYGLYDRKDELWSEFAEAVKETHAALAPVLAGR